MSVDVANWTYHSNIMSLPEKPISNLLFFIGFVLCICGIYWLGYHQGLEQLRKSDSGLGGFAEWAGAVFLLVIGAVVLGVGFVLKKKK